MTWEELVQLAKDSYGLKALEVKYCPLGNAGECIPATAIVIISDKVFLLSEKIIILFHELGHIHCYNNYIWPEFHRAEFPNIKRESIPQFIEMALEAEQWVDEWAANEMKKHFPRITYPFPYKDEINRASFRRSVTKFINNEINKKELELDLNF